MCTGCGATQRDDYKGSRVNHPQEARQYPPRPQGVQQPVPPPTIHNSVQLIRNKKDRVNEEARRQAFHQSHFGGGG